MTASARQLLVIAVLLSAPGAADDRLLVTYASFNADGYDDCEAAIDGYRSIGFRGVSFVPTYYHEHLGEIRADATPSAATIEKCIEHALDSGFRVVYKPHVDPVRYLYGYDAFASDNASWRVNVTWRGFFDFDPVAGQYDEVVIFPALEALKNIHARRRDAPAAAVRFELGAELMNSTIRHGAGWVELARRARKYIRTHGLGAFVKLSHNFSHHIQIEEDFLLRMRSGERRQLARYLESLDELAVSQYMDLTARAPQGASGDGLVRAVADAIAFYQKRFRDLVLDEHLNVRGSGTLPLHIGEFGVGVGGLAHPNYWEGREVDKRAQEIGIAGLLEYLRRSGDGMTATLWTVGPAYDVFADTADAGRNEAAARRIHDYLSE